MRSGVRKREGVRVAHSENISERNKARGIHCYKCCEKMQKLSCLTFVVMPRRHAKSTARIGFGRWKVIKANVRHLAKDLKARNFL